MVSRKHKKAKWLGPRGDEGGRACPALGSAVSQAVQTMPCLWKSRTNLLGHKASPFCLALHPLIRRGSPHFMDEKTDSAGSSGLPRVTQVRCGRPRPLASVFGFTCPLQAVLAAVCQAYSLAEAKCKNLCLGSQLEKGMASSPLM